MCGRFASTQTDADLVRAFRAEEVVGEQLAPSYNVAPTLTEPRRFARSNSEQPWIHAYAPTAAPSADTLQGRRMLATICL